VYFLERTLYIFFIWYIWLKISALKDKKPDYDNYTTGGHRFRFEDDSETSDVHRTTENSFCPLYLMNLIRKWTHKKLEDQLLYLTKEGQEKSSGANKREEQRNNSDLYRDVNVIHVVTDAFPSVSFKSREREKGLKGVLQNVNCVSRPPRELCSILSFPLLRFSPKVTLCYLR